MFCSFCGKLVRKGAVFCPYCGKNLVSGKMQQDINTDVQNPIHYEADKKVKTSLIAIAIVAVLLVFIIRGVGSNSIVGVWMCGTEQITFTKDGVFQMDATYGTYTIESDKRLVLNSGEYSYESGIWEFEYSKEAIGEDYSWWEDGYWYIKGNTLYLHGLEYIRK